MSQKTNIEGGLPKKGGFGQFADLGGGAWQERGVRGVFEEGVDNLMHTMSLSSSKSLDHNCHGPI